jgi:hypothetical protein
MFFLLSEATFTSFFKDKKSQRRHNIVGIKYSYYFCLIIEESESGSGSVPRTNESGSRRPKNIKHWFFLYKRELRQQQSELLIN